MERTYTASAPVTVYYSPTDPSNSRLLPDLRPGVFQRFTLALFILTFGSMFLGWSFLALIIEVVAFFCIS